MMKRPSWDFSDRARAALAGLLAAGLAGGALCLAAPSGEAQGPGRPPSQATVEPQPPLALSLDLISLQKNRDGGVASLRLSAAAPVSVAGVVITARAPGNLVFADGSAVRTWNVDLGTAGTQSIPVDVIVPQDGTFVITAEIVGTIQGKPIHRGAACKLLVGVAERAHKIKGGAIEYPAEPGGGD